MAQRANGVSLLHGQVSRDMFDGLWPGFDHEEVPIGSITNGVHAPTWVDRRMLELAETHLGAAVLDGEGGWEQIRNVNWDQMWAVKRELRQQLVADARRRVRSSWLERGASAAELKWTDEILDPDVLTIGFARRVPTYKRLTLMPVSYTHLDVYKRQLLGRVGRRLPPWPRNDHILIVRM